MKDIPSMNRLRANPAATIPANGIDNLISQEGDIDSTWMYGTSSLPM